MRQSLQSRSMRNFGLPDAIKSFILALAAVAAVLLGLTSERFPLVPGVGMLPEGAEPSSMGE